MSVAKNISFTSAVLYHLSMQGKANNNDNAKGKRKNFLSSRCDDDARGVRDYEY